MKILDFLNTYSPNVLRRPYVIAEAGVNHEGSMDLAKRLIDEAAEGGAHAIKFQTYKAETIASKDSPYYWDITKEPTQSQFELFKKYDSFWKNEYEQLARYCETAGIEFMSTPFDVESAHFLNDLMPIFKVSSSDLTNIPFIEIMCDFGKPMILSTGASYLWEIHQAVEAISKKGNQLCLMHCVLNYPTPDANANLGMIKSLIRHFPDHIPGYSDHTLPKDMEVMKMATLLGAAVIEKHFTHDKSLPGNDHYHAMDKEDMKHFNQLMDRSFELLGSFEVTALEDEAPARANARRSLVAAKEIPQGKIIERSDLTWKRPAKGVSPKDIDQVLGKAAVKTIEEDEIIKWNVIES